MSVILVTGGNKGIGRETARRLADLGHTVYIGSRDSLRGRNTAAEIGVGVLALDVTDDESVAAAARELGRRENRLDVLINNAGIADEPPELADLTISHLQRTFDANFFGAVRAIHGFLPLLRKARTPVIVNVSSGLGSFGLITNPRRVESEHLMPAYGSSKAALNMLTLQYANALPDFKVNAAVPGYTSTDLTNNSPGQSACEGSDAVVELALVGANGPTGTLSDRHGPLPW
ncbi:SDR family NAD(P)-dependent oxidoreductase [Mycobacteriaceae bacterium NPDC060252]